MKKFKTLMQGFTAIYILGGLSFFFLSTLWAKQLGMQSPPNQFWVTLTTSMMAMLAFLSWQSSKHPKEKAFVQCHILSKSVSVSCFLISFLFFAPIPAYLVGAVTDFSIILIILFFYRNVNAARKRA